MEIMAALGMGTLTFLAAYRLLDWLIPDRPPRI
jgi:hypothetical protein